MSSLEVILDWLSSAAWLLTVVFVVFFFRQELKSLVSNPGGVIERARKERVEIAIGEKFKVLFGPTIERVEKEAVRLSPPSLSFT